jgi:RHS repeat-associated protein
VQIAATSRHGFTFHEHLYNVGLIHMNGRVYDPAVGRFLSVDPELGTLTDSQDVNPYSYVRNRPLSAADPSGMFGRFPGDSSGIPGTLFGDGQNDNAYIGTYEVVTHTAVDGAWVDTVEEDGPGTNSPQQSGGNLTFANSNTAQGTSSPQSQTTENSESAGTQVTSAGSGPQNDDSNTAKSAGAQGPMTMAPEQSLSEVLVIALKKVDWWTLGKETWPGFSLGACFSEGGCGGREWAIATFSVLPIPEVKGAMALKEAVAAEKIFSKEKQALLDMAKMDKRKGMTRADMQAYKDLNKGLSDPLPTAKVRGPEAHPGGGPASQVPHGHVGPVDHIPITDR